MKVGMIGTGAISHKHAEAYRNIGFELTVCTDVYEPAGRKFAEKWGCEFVKTYEEVCRHPSAIADVIADVVRDDRRVARVVFGDSGFDLAHEIGADGGGFGVNSAA